MKNYIIKLIKDNSFAETESFNSDGEMCELSEPNYILDDDDIKTIAEEIEKKKTVKVLDELLKTYESGEIDSIDEFLREINYLKSK